MTAISFLAQRRAARLAVGATLGFSILVGGAAIADAAIGHVRTQSTPLTVRSGPGTEFPAVGQVARGAKVNIRCQSVGERVAGPYGASSKWNKIGANRYIADAYTSSKEAAPKCSTEPAAVVAQVASGPATKRINAVIAVAKAQVGRYPYSYGGGNHHTAHTGISYKRWDDRQVTGFDCSGLMQFAFYQGGGKKLAHRVASGQYDDGLQVRWEDRRAGDLVFWSDGSKRQSEIHHVALYIGDNQIIEAANHRADLRVRKVSSHELGLMPFVTRPIR